MAVSRKVEREMLRNEHLYKIIDYLNDDNDVLRVKSNEIAIPVVGCEGNEDFIVITVKVPTGANKGLDPYDGYAEAESYELKLKEKSEKAKANAEKKARKMARDAEIRRKKKEIAEKGEQQFAPWVANIGSRPADFVKKLTFNLGVDKVNIIWYIIYR